MPAYAWPTPPIRVIQAFERRQPGNRGDVGALIMWATHTVDVLHYLDDIDGRHYAGSTPDTGHDPNIVNIAHARWATGSAMTALDLCAAALGREYCANSGPYEFDLGLLDPSSTKQAVANRRSALPPSMRAWVDAVFSDPRYRDVQGARNPLTHARLRRHFFLHGDPPSTEFAITATSKRLTTRELVAQSRDLATERVVEFLRTLEQLS